MSAGATDRAAELVCGWLYRRGLCAEEALSGRLNAWIKVRRAEGAPGLATMRGGSQAFPCWDWSGRPAPRDEALEPEEATRRLLADPRLPADVKDLIRTRADDDAEDDEYFAAEDALHDVTYDFAVFLRGKPVDARAVHLMWSEDASDCVPYAELPATATGNDPYTAADLYSGEECSMVDIMDGFVPEDGGSATYWSTLRDYQDETNGVPGSVSYDHAARTVTFRFG